MSSEYHRLGEPIWAVIVVTKTDGTEICPICWTGDDPLLGDLTTKVPDIDIGQSSYLKQLIGELSDVAGYRLEMLTWKEILDKGYREKPSL